MGWWRRFVRWRNHADYREQSAATTMLQNAWSYLYRTRWNCASSRERNALLPDDQEALAILHKLASASLDKQLTL